MEGYLEHLRSLRRHIGEYEDKADILTVEKHRVETAIRAMEKDLASVEAESEQVDGHMDELVKQKGVISISILKGQREIAKLDNDTTALSDALEALKRETVLQRDSLEKKRAYYEQASAELFAQFEKYKQAVTPSLVEEVAIEDHLASETSAVMDVA